MSEPSSATPGTPDAPSAGARAPGAAGEDVVTMEKIVALSKRRGFVSGGSKGMPAAPGGRAVRSQARTFASALPVANLVPRALRAR